MCPVYLKIAVQFQQNMWLSWFSAVQCWPDSNPNFDPNMTLTLMLVLILNSTLTLTLTLGCVL